MIAFVQQPVAPLKHIHELPLDLFVRSWCKAGFGTTIIRQNAVADCWQKLATRKLFAVFALLRER